MRDRSFNEFKHLINEIVIEDHNVNKLLFESSLEEKFLFKLHNMRICNAINSN